MPAEARARAAFLDRDGTLIVEKNYLSDPADVAFIEGAFDALRLLATAGYELVIVTNQSGIARGMYTIADYHAVSARIDQDLEREGIRLAGSFFCPHHPEHTGPCDCRKPGVGMFREAGQKLDVDVTSSVYIGDRVQDVLPALALGGRGYLVLTGYGKEQAAQAPEGVEVVADVLQAAYEIVGKNRTTA